MTREWVPGDVAMVPGVGVSILTEKRTWATVRGNDRTHVDAGANDEPTKNRWWFRANHDFWKWPEIAAVKVLSPGVTA